MHESSVYNGFPAVLAWPRKRLGAKPRGSLLGGRMGIIST